MNPLLAVGSLNAPPILPMLSQPQSPASTAVAPFRADAIQFGNYRKHLRVETPVQKALNTLLGIERMQPGFNYAKKEAKAINKQLERASAHIPEPRRTAFITQFRNSLSSQEKFEIYQRAYRQEEFELVGIVLSKGLQQLCALPKGSHLPKLKWWTKLFPTKEIILSKEADLPEAELVNRIKHRFPRPDHWERTWEEIVIAAIIIQTPKLMKK